ncbi:MAG: hypothetical protein ACHQD8_03180 [Chitinophagales bacterium]
MKQILYLALCFSSILHGSCKTMQAHKPAPQKAGATAVSMSCKIEGRIIEVMDMRDEDTGSVCSKYPCMAKVKIMDVFGCGSSIMLTLNESDTVEIRFLYTLHNTSELFPTMKTQYPGLKIGDVFIANVEQRLKVGSGVQLIIYDYQLRK